MARLTSLASSRLSRKLARRVDAEDVVLSAWRSFFVATGRDQIDVPSDDNLWPLLVTMTLRKLSRQAAKHSAERRSINAESEWPDEFEWPAVVARDPTPAEAAMVTDEIEQLMSELAVADREILTLRLQGEPHASIAHAVSCSERTVRRSLQRIRAKYLARNDDELGDLSDDSAVRMADGLSIPGASELSDQRISTTSTVPEVGRPSNPTPSIRFSDLVLEELIGRGAFGKVYRATRLTDGAIVAVKYLRKEFWQNSQATEHLIREVSVVSTLTHAGIVRHFGWGNAPRGAVFSVMELVEGTNLETWQRCLRCVVGSSSDGGRARRSDSVQHTSAV
jgi:RNA polymerase sigma factor (sigma-70 family)